MKNKIRTSLGKMFGMAANIEQLNALVRAEHQENKLLLGRILADRLRGNIAHCGIHDAEFSVFSQFGDDGILQYLIHKTRPLVEKFIEFGVENYLEANTRFLLMKDNWSGLILDGNQEYINYVKQDEIYWRHDLTAVCAFVDRDNINQLFVENGFGGEIGLLSIDIDGNDYWVWERIEAVNPVIVTAEYNSVFGPDYAITVPYDPTFVRTVSHHSNLYWGCSLKGLCLLAERKGYAFVGCNSHGNNAHFVRKDKVGDIQTVGVKEGYVESKFRESRDQQGRLTYLSGSQRLDAIKEMTAYNLETDSLIMIADLFEL